MVDLPDIARELVDGRAVATASGDGAIGVAGDANGAVFDVKVIRIDGADRATLSELLVQELPAPRCNLPLLDAAFRGREAEEAELRAALEARGGSQAVTALRGMGGIGKTELAVRVARAVAPFYPAAQILVDLRGTGEAATPQSVMEDVITRFEPGAKLPDDARKTREIYLDLLRRQPSLLVLDNAKDSAQVLPLLPEAPSAAIVTSRGTLELPGVVARRLDCLARDAAIAVLAEHLKAHETDPAELDALAEACLDHPLSLRVVGSYLAQRWEVIAIADHVAEIAGSRARSGRRGPAGLDAVMELLALSLELLRREDDALVERWRDLAVFPADFDAAAAGAVWETEPAEARDLLVAFFDLGLLEPGGRGRYRLHDLMRDLARRDQPPARFDAPVSHHAAHFLARLGAANDLYLKGGAENAGAALADFDRERGNIETGQAWAANHAKDNPAAAAMAMRYPGVGVYVLSLRLHSRTWIAWLETALAAAREIGDRRGEGNHLGNLGFAHAALGDAHAAIAFYEQALAISREIGDRRGEGSDLGNLGNAHARLGDARAAIAFYEQALAIACEIGDRRGEGNALGNLGNAHAALGDARAAIAFYEQALAIAREIGDQRGEGNALGNLGSAHADLGDAHAAIAYHEQALAIAREIGDRRGEGNRLGNLGLAHAALGDARAAIAYHEQALAITREIGDRRGEGNALGNLGLAHAALGAARAAIAFHEQALAISREIGDRRGEGSDLDNLGLAHAALGDARAAIAYHEQALALFEAIEDPNADRVRASIAELRARSQGDE